MANVEEIFATGTRSVGQPKGWMPWFTWPRSGSLRAAATREALDVMCDGSPNVVEAARACGAQKGASGKLTQIWIIVGWLGIAAVIYMSLMPRPPQLGIAHGNRIGHVVVYASLMLWFAQLALVPIQLLRSASGLFALAVGLEFAQLATEYRTFSYMDMAAGALGVVIGWVLAPPRSPNLLSIAKRIAARHAGG